MDNVLSFWLLRARQCNFAIFWILAVVWLRTVIHFGFTPILLTGGAFIVLRSATLCFEKGFDSFWKSLTPAKGVLYSTYSANTKILTTTGLALSLLIFSFLLLYP